MNGMLRNTLMGSVVVLGVSAGVLAQVPAPFPRPGQSSAPQTPKGAAPQPSPVQPVPPPQAAPPDGVPTEVTLGAPIYPSAQYLESYDASRGQRFYIFGSQSDFLQVVAFYKTILKQKGELIFDEPPVHMFDLGRFREDTMTAFPRGTGGRATRTKGGGGGGHAGSRAATLRPRRSNKSQPAGRDPDSRRAATSGGSPLFLR